MQNTDQEQFWQSEFGEEYTDRNEYDPEALDAFYNKTYGVTRSTMNDDFLTSPIPSQRTGGDELKPPPNEGGEEEGVLSKDAKILEVGCNIGNQLRFLQKQGYQNLNGIEILDYAVEKARQLTKNINIIQASAFKMPFKDNEFDLVFTAGVLIHISPKDISKILKEIYRVSKKYIWGFEYFAEEYSEIEYRGNKNRLWKGNFSKMYQDAFPDLKLIKEKKFMYIENDNVDVMFLLEKT